MSRTPISEAYNQDCMIYMAGIPDNSVNCCVTSPPYFGLRDYGHEAQIGLEETPELFVAKLVEIFRELRRVLRDDGTCWLNLGDSYASNQSNNGGYSEKSTLSGFSNPNTKGRIQNSGAASVRIKHGLKHKDLIGIPWMVAFALRADGWYLRQDIIWHKPNPMPESVTDRCTKAHEYIFLLTKSERYWYDAEAISEPVISGSNSSNFHTGKTLLHQGGKTSNRTRLDGEFRNKRSVWTVPTQPLADAHFAAYPEDLIAPCIKAGCPEGGLVLDPFMGSGTTAFVASKLGRNYYGFEINPEYIEIQKKRLHKELGMFSPNYLTTETLEK